jgi:hypothetical protein
MRWIWLSTAAICAALPILILTHASGGVGLIGVGFLGLAVLLLVLRPASHRRTAFVS